MLVLPAIFARVRVDDLKHTYGRRLRSAGVSLETRKLLLAHKNGDITTHYSAAEIGELIAATKSDLRREGHAEYHALARGERGKRGRKSRARVAQKAQSQSRRLAKCLIDWRARQESNPRPPGS